MVALFQSGCQKKDQGKTVCGVTKQKPAGRRERNKSPLLPTGKTAQPLPGYLVDPASSHMLV